MALPNQIGGRVLSTPHNENYVYLEEKTNNLQAQITDLQEQVTSNDGDIAILDSRANSHDTTLTDLQNQITQNENDIETKYADHIAGIADKHGNADDINESDVAGTSTKDALNKLKSDDSVTNARIDNIIAQSGTSSTEVVDSRHSAKYGQYATVDARLEAIEGRSKYFWKEIHSVALGGDTLTLENIPEVTDYLEIKDVEYGCLWSKDVHYTIQGNIITFTSTIPEDLTFIIINLG